MIRSKRNQPTSSRLAARRMLAAIVLSSTTLHAAALRADDSMQRLTKPDELAQVAPMRAIGLRIAPPKTLSSLNAPKENRDIPVSAIHPTVALPTLPLPPTARLDLATDSLPALPAPNLPTIASSAAHAIPDLRLSTISTASHTTTDTPAAVPASMVTPVDTPTSPDRVSFRLGAASGSTNAANTSPIVASQPIPPASSDVTGPRDSHAPLALPPSSPRALDNGGQPQARMPQQIKPQTVRSHSANTTSTTATTPQSSSHNGGSAPSNGNTFKVTKSDGITQHTPVRLSFSNDSVTAAPLARSSQGHTVMGSGAEIPVSVRSLAPNSKVLQASKLSQPALVSAVPPYPESSDTPHSHATETPDDASQTADATHSVDAAPSVNLEIDPGVIEHDESHVASDPSLSLPKPSPSASATHSQPTFAARTGSVAAAIEPTIEPLESALIPEHPRSAHNDANSLSVVANATATPAQSTPLHPATLPPASPTRASPTIASSTPATTSPAIPTPAILASRVQIAKSESSAPVSIAHLPKQGRISLASNSTGGLRIVPVESNPGSSHASDSNTEPAPSATPPAVESNAASLLATSSDAEPSNAAPRVSEAPQTNSGSMPNVIAAATPAILETDTPSDPVSLILPHVSVAATTEKVSDEETLEDRPPSLTNQPKGTSTKDSSRNQEPVLPRGPVVTTGPLESGVVPESTPRLEIESQSANAFLVEGKITFIHIVDPDVCRAVASDGKIFVVGNALGETSIALRTAESTEPIFVRVAVVTPWQNAKQGVADIEQLRATIANVVPESRLRIQPQSDGSLWVIGTVDSNDKAKRVMELTRKLVLVPVVDKLEVR